LPAFKRGSSVSLLILFSLLVLALFALPSGVYATNNARESRFVPVNLLIDYGNGTLDWINHWVPSTWNFYNVTVFDTRGNISSIFYASFDSHFVYQINGVGCPSSNPFCASSWGLWTLEGSCWTLANVGVDQIPVSYHATVGWYLVPAESLGQTPPTGVNCVQVNIDVKPPADPAVINPFARGTIPVAILSSPTFNVTSQIIVSSLTFGETGTEHSLAFCNGYTQAGLTNLMCYFRTRSASFHAGDTEAILNGLTVSGTPIFGTDSIVVV
jgi:hypothetical protein